jgi:hypothetical protein
MQPREEELARRQEEDLDGRGFRGNRLRCALTGVRRGQSGLEAFVVVWSRFGQNLVKTHDLFGFRPNFVELNCSITYLLK